VPPGATGRGAKMRIKIDHLLILILSLMPHLYVIQKDIHREINFRGEIMSSYYEQCLDYLQTQSSGMTLLSQ